MRYADSLQVDVAEGIQVEHICLESEGFSVDGRAHGARVGPALTIESPFRGCRTELALLDGHRLAVHAERPRRPPREYVVDLRFLDDEPVARRHIAWHCWLASALLAALGFASYRFGAVPEIPPWLYAGLPATLVLLAAAFGVAAAALYRTHEVLELRSVHGRATLVEVTGNLGCARAAAAFCSDVARRVAEARAQAAQSRQRFLCDELQEHRRLLGEGILSQDVYEAGKRLILQAHG